MIARRTLLRGMLGGSVIGLGLPLFEQMLNHHGTALAQGIPLPKRYGLFWWGNGLPLTYRHNATSLESGDQYLEYKNETPDRWTPEATGKNWQISEMLAPLANHQANINVVTGTEVITEIPTDPPGQSDGHLRGAIVALTADRPDSDGFGLGLFTAKVLRPTLDQFIAHHEQFYTDGEPSFRSLEIGVNKSFFRDFGTWVAVSHAGPNLLNAPIYDPKQLFDFVFAVPPDTSEVARRVSVLDVVADDTSRLMNKLGMRDRQRLDEHLTHLRAIEQRLQDGVGVCGVPAEPSGTFEGALQDAAKYDLLSDILVAALRCDLTRVFSIMFTPAGGGMLMNPAGEIEGTDSSELHVASHFQLQETDPGHQIMEQATLFHMRGFATLLDKLSADADVNGQTLLDSACIFGTSELGDGFHHGTLEMPCLIAGKAGGALDTGWHVRDERGNFCRAHYTILRAMGIDVPSYGFSGAETSNGFEFLNA